MSKELLVRELNDMRLSDDVMEKHFITQLREAINDLPVDITKQIELGELQDLYANKVSTMMRRIVDEETDATYTEEELIALVSFYKLNPWSIEKGATNQINITNRLLHEEDLIIQEWWCERLPGLKFASQS